jgi:hypothetical protein
LLTLPQDNAQNTHDLGTSLYMPCFADNPSQVPSGPNQNLYIVGTKNGQSTLSDTSQYPWEYSPALQNPNSAFYQAQSGSCWAGVQAIINSIQGHEAGATSSHYSEVQAALAANNPGVLAEGVVAADLNSVRQAVNALYVAVQAAGAPEPSSPPIAINFYPYHQCP